MNRLIAFDIETGPADDLHTSIPTFTGRKGTNDPDKIASQIKEKEEAYISEAALSPYTGKILAIGVVEAGEPAQLFHGPDESEIITKFLTHLSHNTSALFVAHNAFGFDLPFIIRRAWKHNLSMPLCLQSIGGSGHIRGRGHFGCTMEKAAAGTRNQWVGLDALARFFGLGKKTGEGAMFGELYRSDQPAALRYLENDVKLTLSIAERMGLDEERP